MFSSFENTLQPSLSEWLIQTCKIHLVAWVKFKIESKPPLSTCAYLSILWFAFVTLGLFGPRWLGVAGEQPRDCGCFGKFVTVDSVASESFSGRRKRSRKRLQLEWPLWYPLGLTFTGSPAAPSMESRTRTSPNFDKTNIVSQFAFHSIFVSL